jgi:colicin import membrane protein
MMGGMNLSRLAVCGGLLLALVPIAAAPASAANADDAERAQIAAERAALDARYHSAERECREHFVVTSCVDDAKRERRRGLDALKSRQLVLDEARRRARTAERSAELAAKAADDAGRERAARSGSASASAARHDGATHAAPAHDAAASAVAKPEVPHARHGTSAASGARTGHAEST